MPEFPIAATFRWLRAVQAHPSTRDRVLAQLPFYADIRIIETVRLDLDDIQLSARKGTLRVLGNGDKDPRNPLHPQLRTDPHLWLHERPDWPEATRNPALLLNNRGGRLTARGASGIFRQIADNAGLDDPTTAHIILRHTFATALIRGGTDFVIVAELLGHAPVAGTSQTLPVGGPQRQRKSACGTSFRITGVSALFLYLLTPGCDHACEDWSAE